MMQFDINVQRQIIWFGLDDCSPVAMLPQLHGGQDGNAQWRWRHDVIALICRLVDARLIVPVLKDYQEKSSDQLRHFLVCGDPDNGFDIEMVWLVMHLDGTDTLHKLLRRLNFDDWDAMNAELSRPLAEALAELNVVEL